MRIQLLGINFAPERTGIAPYTTALARHLSRNHEVTVITGLPHYPDWQVAPGFRHWRRDEQDGNLRVIRLGHWVPKHPNVLNRGLYEATWALRATAAGSRIPADVVISVVPALLGAHAGRAVATRHDAPMGIVVQDVMSTAAAQTGMHGGRLVSRITSRLERAALRRADRVATIHPRLAEDLAAFTRTRPATIYNWTHVTARPRPDRCMRESLGWRPDDVVALHSGNMGSKQNLEVVIDAARLAEREGSPIHFVLAGGGSRRAGLERYARGCGNVTFMGTVPDNDYMDLLAAADVLLVNERPKMCEMSLPSKLTSYLVAGRPIVAATDEDSATAEFVRASGGGLVTPAGDHGQLLDVVSKLVADGALSARLASDGHAFATDYLCEDAAMAGYDHWLADLASHRPRVSALEPRLGVMVDEPAIRPRDALA